MSNYDTLGMIKQRLEILYQMVDELERSGGGGGEPGTTNYNDLTNKPSVNGHILIGSKTSSDLDLQPVISDLSTIRSGAALGATAVQPSDMEEALDDKVDKVAGKGLSTNDFTNADKAQITTNKNGITAVANRGSKNQLDVSQTPSSMNAGNITITKGADGSLTFNGTSTAVSDVIIGRITLPAGDYVLSGCAEGGSLGTWLIRIYGDPNITNASDTAGTVFHTDGITNASVRIVVGGNKTLTNAVFKPMICTKAEWDISQEFVRYAPTNRELFENKANQAEVSTIANRGSKNLLPIKNHAVGDVTETNGFRFTVQADGGILIESIGTHSGNGDYYLIGQWGNRDTLIDCSDGTYTATLEANDDTVSKVSMRIYKAGNSHIVNNVYANTSANFTGEITFIFITAYTDAVIPSGGVVVYPMIRNASIEDNTYVPYAPTNRELYEMILALQ